MEKFKLDTRATLMHINTRKEGNEDDKALALDLKFTARLQASAANYFGDDLASFLFLEDGVPRYKSMEDIGFKFELANYCLNLHEQDYFGVTVKKFKVQAVNGGMVDLTFSVSFNPTSQIVAMLAEFLDELIDVKLGPADRELDFNGEISQAEKLIDELSKLTPHSGEFDPHLDDARAYVIASGKANISALQRYLKIGYNRAARLIEALEGENVVSPMQSDGARTVLIN